MVYRGVLFAWPDAGGHAIHEKLHARSLLGQRPSAILEYAWRRDGDASNYLESADGSAGRLGQFRIRFRNRDRLHLYRLVADVSDPRAPARRLMIWL